MKVKFLMDVNYSLNSINKLPILNPGSKYITTTTSQNSEGTTPSSSLVYYKRFPQETVIGNQDQFKISFTSFDTLMVTGSGTLTLSGSDVGTIMMNNQITQQSQFFLPIFDFIYTGLAGPFLSVLHNYNYCLKNDIFTTTDLSGTPSTIYYGVSPGIDNTNQNNYIRWNSETGSFQMYENVNEPFLIERGDEIRISYISGSVDFEAVQQDFTVLDVGFTDYTSGSADNAFVTFNNSNLAGTGSSEILED
jgi:hypothetical protein